MGYNVFMEIVKAGYQSEIVNFITLYYNEFHNINSEETQTDSKKNVITWLDFGLPSDKLWGYKGENILYRRTYDQDLHYADLCDVEELFNYYTISLQKMNYKNKVWFTILLENKNISKIFPLYIWNDEEEPIRCLAIRYIEKIAYGDNKPSTLTNAIEIRIIGPLKNNQKPFALFISPYCFIDDSVKAINFSIKNKSLWI